MITEISEIFSQQKTIEEEEESQSVVIMDSTNVFITFKIKDNDYICKIEQVKEVLEYKHITPYPIPFKIQKGIINLRGSIVPIFDIGDTNLDEVDNTKRMIIFELEQSVLVGLICEHVKRIYIPEITDSTKLTNGDVVTFENTPIKYVDISTLLESNMGKDHGTK